MNGYKPDFILALQSNSIQIQFKFVLGRFGASCGRLGGVLGVSCARVSIQKELDLGMLFWTTFSIDTANYHTHMRVVLDPPVRYAPVQPFKIMDLLNNGHSAIRPPPVTRWRWRNGRHLYRLRSRRRYNIDNIYKLHNGSWYRWSGMWWGGARKAWGWGVHAGSLWGLCQVVLRCAVLAAHVRDRVGGGWIAASSDTWWCLKARGGGGGKAVGDQN